MLISDNNVVANELKKKIKIFSSNYKCHREKEKNIDYNSLIDLLLIG